MNVQGILTGLVEKPASYPPLAVILISLTFLILTNLFLIRMVYVLIKWWTMLDLDGIWLRSEAKVDRINPWRLHIGHKLFFNLNHVEYHAVKYGIITRNVIYSLPDAELNLQTRISGFKTKRVDVWIGPVTMENHEKVESFLKKYIIWTKEKLNPLGGQMLPMKDIDPNYDRWELLMSELRDELSN